MSKNKAAPTRKSARRNPKPEMADLVQRLAEAEAALQALMANQVDAVVDSVSGAPLLLRQAQEVLRKSEARFRVLAETTSAAIFIVEGMHILYANDAAQSLTGYSRDELLNMELWQFAHPTYQEVLKQHGLQHLWAENVPNRFELRIVTKAGEERWWDVTIGSIEYDGKPAFVLTAFDITERKRAEEALRYSNARLQLLSDTASQLLASDEPQKIIEALCDQVLRFLDCQAFFNYLVDPDEHRLRLNACAGIPADAGQRIEWLDFGEAVCGCVARDGVCIVAENILESCDPRADLVRSFGIQAYAGHPLIARGRIIGTLSFGTRTRTHFTEGELALMKAVADQVAIAVERKRAEEALHQRNEELEAARTEAENERRRLEAVMEALPVGVAITDVQGGTIQSNSAFERMWGAPRPSTRSVSDYAAYKARWVDTGKAVAPEEWASAQATQKGEPVVGQLMELQRFDGSCAFVINSASPVRDASGKIVGSAVAIQDITDLRKAEQALRESEERYRSLVEFAPEAIGVHREGKWLYVNPACVKLWGATDPSQIIGRPVLDMIHPDDREVIRERVRLTAETGERAPLRETCIVRLDGQVVHVESAAVSTVFQGKQANLVMIRDISERKRAEEALHRLNRTLRARSHSDQALMHATNEAEFMEEVCRIVVEDCGHAMVWVGFAEEDEAKSVRPVAYAGFEEGYLETLHITWADVERGRGPTGTAIRTGQPSFCRNMLTDPKFTPWRAEALKRGYASSLVLPLLDNNRAFGALTIYFRGPDPFTEDEIALLSGLADDLAYGIKTLRLRAAHAQVEAALRAGEERYRSLFEGMTEGFALHEIICDEQGQPCDYRFLEINPSFERLTGLAREDVVGKTHNEVLPNDSPIWVKTYGQVALTGQPVHFENYSPVLKRHYEVYAYRPAPRQFAVLFMDVTERRQMEVALRQSEERARDQAARLRALLDAAPAIIWTAHDRECRTISGNRAAHQSLRVPEGTNMSKSGPASERIAHFRVCKDGVELAPEEMPIQRAAASGLALSDYAMEIAFDDGTVRSLLGNVAPVFDSEGRPSGAIAAFVDITERQQAEMERERLLDENRQQRRLLETLFEADPDGLSVVTGEELVVQLANPAYRAFTPHPNENPVGQCWDQVWAGVVMPKVVSAIRRVMVTGEPVDEESQKRVYPDGQTRYFSFHARRLLWNTEYAVLNVLQETTAIEEARRRASEAAQEAQRRAAELDATISAIADGVVIVDRDARIQRMNPAAETILGYSEAQCAMSLDERVALLQLETAEGAPVTRPEDTPVRRALRGETVQGFVMSARVQGEHKKWLSTSAAPVRTSDGRTLGAVVSFTDITILRMTQQRLEESNEELEVQTEELQVTMQELSKARDELELRVQERTAELTQTNAALQAGIVERRRAEEALKAERQRFNDVLEMLPAYLVLLTPDYHVAFANRFFRERFGESHGKRCFEYLFGRSEPCEVCETYKVLKTMSPLNWDWTGPDGRNYNVFDYPFTDTDGSTLILEMGSDVTERKHAEEGLRLANAYNRSLIEASLDPLVTIGPDGKITDANTATEHITGCPRTELIGTDFSDYFTEPEKARAGYQHVFREGLVRDYALELRHRDGHVTPVFYNATVYRDGAGQVTGVFAAARDITERVLAYQVLEQRVEERTRELSTLLTISHNVASTLELEPLLNLILDLLKVMVDYTSASILMLDRDDLIVTEYQGPLRRDEVLHTRFPLQGAIATREVISRCEPVIIADLEDDSPLARAYQAFASEEQKRVIGDARSWMGIPLMIKDQVFGMLRLSHDQPNYFSVRHAQLALAIANQAAVAIENARLYERAQQAAALEERQRLARELHDSVSQALYGIALGTHTALAMRDRDPVKLTEALNYVLSLADAGLTEMRALIFELRPESLEMEGLVAALSKQAAALTARHNIAVKTQFCPEPDVRIQVKEALYRIAQEALHNAAKHARPNRIDVQLACTTHECVLEIADDGLGFETNQTFAGHLGLRSMHERAARLGGAVEIESAPGHGTHIRATIPMRAA